MNGPQLYLKCEYCGTFFEHNGGKRRRFCTDAHKQAAWRALQQGALIRSLSHHRNARSVIIPPPQPAAPEDSA